MTFDSSDNLADACALYAAGALSFDENAEFVERLAAGWPAAEAALAECERAVLALVADIPAVVPPPDVKRRLMDRIAPTVPDGYVIRRPPPAGTRPAPSSRCRPGCCLPERCTPRPWRARGAA